MAEWRVAKDMNRYYFKNKDTPTTHSAAKCIHEEVIYRSSEMSTAQIHVKHDLNPEFLTFLMSSSTL
jgi:hypothetical protein